jgi:polyisoprenoid-binding protein YceI
MSTVTTAPGIEPAPLRAPAGLWTVVPDASRAGFSVRDKLVWAVHGTMPAEDGAVVASDTGEVTQAWVSVSVAGIATGTTRRDTDLRKARFLDAGRCPSVRITVHAPTMTADGCSSAGTVLARGVRVPVHLVAALADRPTWTTQVRVHVTGTLDRRPLSIKVPTFVIERYVHLDADLVFRRGAGAEAEAAGDAL